MGVVLGLALLGLACDELPVGAPPGRDLDISAGAAKPVLMVGQIDTIALIVVRDNQRLTGLRVRWFSEDPTALTVRSLADSSRLDTSATATDTLDATLQAEVSLLRRGLHFIRVSIDSVSGDVGDAGEIPFEVEERWQSVSAGVGHTCAVTFATTFPGTLEEEARPFREGGEGFCWGEGQFGALGTGSSTLATEPRNVSSDVSFREVRTGAGFSCALDGVGLLYCWGDNFHGQLGLGNSLDQFVPRLNALGVSFGSFDLGKASQFTCAVLAQGTDQVFGGEATEGGQATLCWGQNELGQLGCGTREECDPVALAEPNTADAVTVVDEELNAPQFVALSLGAHHGCGAEADGRTLCWGSNDSFELGSVTDTTFSRFALEVDGFLFEKVAAGGGFSCGVERGGGGVWCWGRVVGGEAESEVPDAIDGIVGRVVDLTAGWYHACALTEAGAAYCWGDNSNGQLGDGTTNPRITAAQVEAPLDLGGRAIHFGVISAGATHTCAIAETQFELRGSPLILPSSGGIYCWGDNGLGELGVGHTESVGLPTRVLEPAVQSVQLLPPG